MTARTTAGEGVNELQAALADDRAFESWHRRTLPRVYSYLLSRCAGDVTLAEELTQQTFIAAIDRRSRFDGRSDAITWLCGIARHKLADHFRSIAREERRQMQIEVRQIELDSDVRHQIGLEDRTPNPSCSARARASVERTPARLSHDRTAPFDDRADRRRHPAG